MPVTTAREITQSKDCIVSIPIHPEITPELTQRVAQAVIESLRV